jgi:hypothetical protein
MGSDNILNQNMRGLKSGLHRDALRNPVTSENLTTVSVQETKLAVIHDFVISQLLGTGSDYSILPMVHIGGHSGCLEGRFLVSLVHFFTILLVLCKVEKPSLRP